MPERYTSIPGGQGEVWPRRTVLGQCSRYSGSSHPERPAPRTYSRPCRRTPGGVKYCSFVLIASHFFVHRLPRVWPLFVFTLDFDFAMCFSNLLACYFCHCSFDLLPVLFSGLSFCICLLRCMFIKLSFGSNILQLWSYFKYIHYMYSLLSPFWF